MRADGGDPELAPEAVLPSQFFARPAAPGRGEQRLMLAVLDRAVWELQQSARAGGARARRLQAEVAAWFASDDEAWPFTFVNLCRALGFDPSYIRRGLTALDGPCSDAHGLRARVRRIATGPRTMTVRPALLRRAG
jgi:hypothetical protein